MTVKIVEPSETDRSDFEALLEACEHPSLSDQQRVEMAKFAYAHLFKSPVTIDELADATNLDPARVEAVLDRIDGRVIEGAATLNGVQRGAVTTTKISQPR